MERTTPITAATCKPQSFECLDKQCINNDWVCDGEIDCTEGEDEKDCCELEFCLSFFFFSF